MDKDQSIDSKLYKDLSPQDQNNVFPMLLRHEDQLRQMYFDAVERSIKSLFLLNAGGVVTILTYIYKLSSSWSKTLLSISLIFFLVGLLLAVLVVFLEFKRSHSAHMTFSNNTSNYFLNKIPYSAIHQFQVINLIHIICVGYISAVCIPLGVLLGIIGYWIQ